MSVIRGRTDRSKDKVVSVPNKYHAVKTWRSGGEQSASRHGHFTLGERASGIPSAGGWVGTGAGPNAVTKRSPFRFPLPGIEHQSYISYPNLCTDCATPRLALRIPLKPYDLDTRYRCILE
jgi:hypothetical protein